MSGIRILCGAAALLTSTSAFAQAGEWRLSEVSGRVVVRDAAGDHPVVRGALVPVGATVLTGPASRAVMVRGEDFVSVAAGSRLRVPTAAEQTGLFQMIEEWGSAVFKIKHLTQPHFAVQTPYLAAVVKGTTFSVTVTGEGASLQVIDGAVEVATTDGGAHELVRPGIVAAVTAADRFRLAVQGQTSRTIDSPARPALEPRAATPAASSAPAGHREAARIDHSDDMAWSDVSGSVVAAPITAKPVDLAAATGGMVSGRAGVEVAALVEPHVHASAAAAAAAVKAPAEAAAAVTRGQATDDAANGRADVTKPAGDAEEPAAAAPKHLDDGQNIVADDGKKADDAGVKAADDAAKKAGDDAKKADDAAKHASDDATKAADDAAKKAADDAKKADDAAKHASDDAAKAADDAAKKAADDAKKADDAAKHASDDAAKATDDAAKKAADDAKKADDAAKQASDDAGKAANDTAKKAADDAKKADDTAKRGDNSGKFGPGLKGLIKALKGDLD